jgi:hypothetical protein
MNCVLLSLLSLTVCVCSEKLDCSTMVRSDCKYKNGCWFDSTTCRPFADKVAAIAVGQAHVPPATVTVAPTAADPATVPPTSDPYASYAELGSGEPEREGKLSLDGRPISSEDTEEPESENKGTSPLVVACPDWTGQKVRCRNKGCVFDAESKVCDYPETTTPAPVTAKHSNKVCSYFHDKKVRCGNNGCSFNAVDGVCSTPLSAEEIAKPPTKVCSDFHDKKVRCGNNGCSFNAVDGVCSTPLSAEELVTTATEVVPATTPPASPPETENDVSISRQGKACDMFQAKPVRCARYGCAYVGKTKMCKEPKACGEFSTKKVRCIANNCGFNEGTQTCTKCSHMSHQPNKCRSYTSCTYDSTANSCGYTTDEAAVAAVPIPAQAAAQGTFKIDECGYITIETLCGKMAWERCIWSEEGLCLG